MEEIKMRLQQVKRQITDAAVAAQRKPEDIQLLAVSKTRLAEEVVVAYEAGQLSFGENYLQDALTKIDELQHLPLEWHFIGALQSNKTRPVAEFFDWVHTVDREKIAIRLNDQRPAAKGKLNVCIQVNVDEAETKAGVALNDVEELAAKIAGLPNIALRGLMAIPDPADSFEEQRRPFARLRECFEQLNRKGFAMDTLSIGMSDDMQAAIAEGGTMVRIGTAIFGPRRKKGG